MINILPKTKRNHILITLTSLTLFISLISFSTNRSAGLIEDVLEQTNKFRAANGLPELEMLEDLNAIAQKHSENMASGRVSFGHNGFAKRAALARKKIEATNGFAENVAYGPTSATQLLDMWKDSPPHRRNMLGKYEYVGIGIAKDRRGTMYYTMVFAD